MKTALWLLLFAFGCTACQPSKEQEAEHEESAKVEEARQQVITVHDEAMPLMSDIYQLKKSLKNQRKDSASLTPSRTQALEDVLLRLDSADKGMRIWMREFSNVKTTDVDEDEALRNLDLEMTKIKKVRESMFSAVEDARKISESK
jgi:hypothetical protein